MKQIKTKMNYLNYLFVKKDHLTIGGEGGGGIGASFLSLLFFSLFSLIGGDGGGMGIF